MTLVVPDEDENNNSEDDGRTDDYFQPYQGYPSTMADTYRGDSFPSSIADIMWASALGRATAEGRDVRDKNVRREIFYETFPNASEDGFEEYTTLPTDEDFKYRPKNKFPAGFRILGSTGNVIRDFGRGGGDTMANETVEDQLKVAVQASFTIQFLIGVKSMGLLCRDRPLMQSVKILMRRWIGSQILKLFAMEL